MKAINLLKPKLKFAKVKKVSIPKLKKKAWEVFSKWIRMNGAGENYGTQMCITCGTFKPWKELQAGHFIPGRHNSILFDERGVHPQCYHCNVGLKGNPRKYDKYMRENYGEVVIRDLERLDMINKDFKPYELEEIYEKYKNKVEELS